MISIEAIEDYFKQLDWPFEREDEQNWTTGYKGEKYTFPVYVRIDDFWLYIYTPLPVRVHPLVQGAFYEYLLHLNQEVNLAKFIIDDDGDIGFTVELPNEGLSLHMFEAALRVLCMYMDEKYVELVNAATNAPTPSA